MPRGRVIWGIVAGIVAIAAVTVVDVLETRFFGVASRESLWVAFVGSGGAVLWLADRLGLLASAYTDPTLGLNERAPSDRDDRTIR